MVCKILLGWKLPEDWSFVCVLFCFSSFWDSCDNKRTIMGRCSEIFVEWMNGWGKMDVGQKLTLNNSMKYESLGSITKLCCQWKIPNTLLGSLSNFIWKLVNAHFKRCWFFCHLSSKYVNNWAEKEKWLYFLWWSNDLFYGNQKHDR